VLTSLSAIGEPHSPEAITILIQNEMNFKCVENVRIVFVKTEIHTYKIP